MTRRRKLAAHRQHDGQLVPSPRPTRERYAVPFIRIHARCGFRSCPSPATAAWATFGGGKRLQFLLCGGCSSMLFMASRKADASAADIVTLLEGPPRADHTITLALNQHDDVT